MQSKKNSQLTIAISCSFIYLIINLLIDSLWKFYQIHNDYWDLLFMSKNITFTNLHSLFNPCFPIGYPLLIHFVIIPGSEVVVPIILNVISGAVVVFFSLLLYQKALSSFCSIAAALTAGFFPPFFYYFNQAGADPGAVMFFTVGSLLILEQIIFQKGNKKPAVYFFAGVMLGCGAIIRYHVLVGSAMLLFTAFIFDIKNWKLILISAFGLSLLYLPQIILNVLTGHGMLETKLGASNIYDMMYRINWYKVSTEKISTNALDIISTNYLLFLKKYLISFVSLFIQTGLVPLIVTVSARRPEARRISLFVTIFVLIYLGFFSATLSGGRILLPVSLSMLTFGFLIEDISRPAGMAFRSSVYKISGLVIVVLCCLAMVEEDIVRIVGNIKEYRISTDVEKFLIGTGCTDTKQIFTTDYTVNFNKLPGYFGYFNGGWSRWGTYKYNEAFPEISVNTIDSFLKDCKKHDVRYLMLNSDAGKLSDDLGRIYNLNLKRSDIVFEKEIDRIRIYQLNL